jgi:hypothetical protein
VNPPQDPRNDPLQDDEIALARVLRALPAGEPSPSVDAAILAAATDAVPRRRKAGAGLRWLPTWALGTAAAAVLAVGIGMQLRPPLVPPPPTASTSEQARELPQARPRMAVDLAEPELAPIPPPAPPPSQPQAAPRTTAPAAPSPPAPVAIPEIPAAPAESSAREEAAPSPFDDVSGFAPPPGPAPMGAPDAERDSATLDRVEVSGTRIRAPNTTNHAARIASAEAAAAEARAQVAADERARRRSEAEVTSADRMQAKALTAPLPPVSEDAALPPGEWLDRIRARRDQGDRPGARESLALFLRAHPDAPVPGDLAPLR